MKGKKILKAIGKSLISPVGIGLWAADAEFNNPVADGTRDGHSKRQKQILLDKLPKETRKKLKTFKQFQEEMMGGGAPTNNVGGGQIAGTVEAGDDPPVKKKRKAWNKGKKYMKGSRKQWMV